MDLATAAAVFVGVRRARGRERWSRERLLRYQAGRLADLRQHALAHSAFYRRFHGPDPTREFTSLPSLTKQQAMDAFDEIVTDPRITLAGARAHVVSHGGQPFHGAQVLMTSGSTGEPGLYVHDRASWIAILASLARSREWAGAALKPWARMRSASVTTNDGRSISSRLAGSLRSWWVPLLPLDARQPLAETVRLLNDWQPEMLVVYASVGRVLAEERRAGRLTISPRLIFTTAEVLTPQTRRAIASAFGTEPFNRYSSTETGDLATECREGRRIHLYEDTAVFEVVDEDDRPVPSGEWGAKVLVTPFANQLQPLIRYELSDQLRLSDEPCPCGRPFRVIEQIRGRVEEYFDLPALTGEGTVRIHSFVLEYPVDDLPLSGFQMVQEGDALTLRLERYRGDLDDAALTRRLVDVLAEEGARASRITIEHHASLPRGPGGKAPRPRIGTVVMDAEDA